MIEAPVAKGLLATGSVGSLLGLALVGGGAYYVYKRFLKKGDDQAVEGEVVEQSQEAEVAAA